MASAVCAGAGRLAQIAVPAAASSATTVARLPPSNPVRCTSGTSRFVAPSVVGSQPLERVFDLACRLPSLIGILLETGPDESIHTARSRGAELAIDGG